MIQKEVTIIIPYSENIESREEYHWLYTPDKENLLKHVSDLEMFRLGRYPDKEPKIKAFVAIHSRNGRSVVQGYISSVLLGQYEADDSILEKLQTQERSEHIREIAKKVNLENYGRLLDLYRP